MSYNREDRQMFDAKCGDCGTDCQVPFQPKEDRPVYCRECFQNHKPAPRNRDRFGGRQGGRFGRRDDRPREMHDAKCGDCGSDCQVPFQPKEDRPVSCLSLIPSSRGRRPPTCRSLRVSVHHKKQMNYDGVPA